MSDVKLKKDGTPYKKKVAKTPEAKANQAKTQFKPGNNANKDAWNLRKERREFRIKCANVLLSDEGTKAMVTMLVNSANDGKFRDFMEIYTFLRDTAFGTPGAMIDDEKEELLSQDKLSESQKPLLVVASDLMDTLSKDDANYE